MAPNKRKRSRPTHTNESAAHTRPPPSKKPAVEEEEEEDEDILSDDVDGDIDQREMPPSPAQSDSEPDAPANETAEERRLRLARSYLQHVGVSEDATEVRDGQFLDGDNDGEGSDSDNERLKESALAASGRRVTRVADSLAARFPLSVTAARGDKRKGLRHVCAPTCVSLAQDGGAICASGGKDSRVILWDVATGRATRVFRPDDLAGRRAGSVRDPATVRNGHVGPVWAVAVSDDGHLVASGGADSLVRVWDVRDDSRACVAALRGHKGGVNGLSLRAGSRQLFSAGEDRVVKLWDLGERAYIETLFGHGAPVSAVDAMVSERALSCGRDGTVRLYKVAEGSQLLFRNASTMSIDTVCSVNDQRFVSGGDDGSICLWHLNKKRPTAVAKWAHGQGLGVESWISTLCAVRNSDLAISGAGDAKVRLWRCEDIPKLVEVNNIDFGLGFVNGLSVSKKGNVLAVAVGNEHRLGRWSTVRRAKNAIHFVSLPVEGQ